MAKVQRVYGKEFTVADIIYNPNTRSVFATFDFGFMGRKTVSFVKREDGAYDLCVPYKDKNGNEQMATIGKTFPVKDKNGAIVEGITRGTLGLGKVYDKELKKEIVSNNNALFIITHKLKENKPLGNSGYLKIGYIKGQFGIEIETQQNQVQNPTQPEPEVPDFNEEEIPF